MNQPIKVTRDVSVTEIMTAVRLLRRFKDALPPDHPAAAHLIGAARHLLDQLPPPTTQGEQA